MWQHEWVEHVQAGVSYQIVLRARFAQCWLLCMNIFLGVPLGIEGVANPLYAFIIYFSLCSFLSCWLWNGLGWMRLGFTSKVS